MMDNTSMMIHCKHWPHVSGRQMCTFIRNLIETDIFIELWTSKISQRGITSRVSTPVTAEVVGHLHRHMHRFHIDGCGTTTAVTTQSNFIPCIRFIIKGTLHWYDGGFILNRTKVLDYFMAATSTSSESVFLEYECCV